MVELKINALNQLRLLKQSTFKDMLTFLDEDIQNAQRAHAKNVKISINRWTDGSVVIFNDGEILDDPQKLFSIAESGWTDESVKSENPFGIGFFSNIVVSDYITIKTGDKLITFDVNKMLEKGDTEVEVEIMNPEDYVDGFELTLHNVNFSKVSNYDMEKRIQALSNYIHEIDFECNGEKLEHIPLTECDKDCPYWKTIDNDKCKGWIAAGNNYIWGDSIELYYKGRFIIELPSVPYIEGKLHINDDVLDLVAPDRKDIIRNEKYKAFVDEIKEIASTYFTELVLEMNDNDKFSEYSRCIKYYYKEDEVKDKIKFITFNTQDDKSMEYLSGLALACTADESIKSLEDYNESLRVEESEPDVEPEINVEMNIEEYEPESDIREKTVVYESSYAPTHVPKYDPLAYISESEKNTTSIMSRLLSESKEPVFYVKFKDIKSSAAKLAIARHYNLRIILCQNDIEYDILSHMKYTEDGAPVVSIDELKEDVEINASIKNTKLTAKEKRASMLFGMLSRMAGYDENVFIIGDISVTKTVYIHSVNVSNTFKDDKVTVLYDEEYDRIYIDRKIINDRKLTPNLSSKLNIKDMQFIIANLDNIASALSGFGNVGYLPSIKNRSDIEDIKNHILLCLSLYESDKTLNEADAENNTKKLSRRDKKRLAKANRMKRES